MDGIVVIDKPAGLTSHDVVSEVKKILGAKKAGHTGTLDPMATGVLPVCINEATKLAQFLSAEKKTYLATMLLGVQTDTQDTEGEVTQKSDRVVPEEDVREALRSMVGHIKQVPPAYSALKHKGKPLYKYARAGEFPEISARDVEIFSLNVRDISFPYVTFDISCSKGTYIRTVCSDVGNALGCGATLSGLRRLQSGFFTEDMALSLEDVPVAEKKKELLAKMLPMAQCLRIFATIEVSESLADKLRTGFQPDVEMMRQNVLPFLAAGDMIKFISPGGHLVAVAEMQMPTSEMADRNGRTQAARMLRIFNGTN
ncbi:MAG TPA: tRNA pseudouridine(55) synthase TruB [Smithellaceae bacterium]|nr:tRNA pseudouridine(55) synthase TruB [Smithellaceae bacterium]HPE06420.1 tRNA pseudouridine(55) synthase TruB [Smithellaceae bacterium]HRY38013.1 tRNA pseudouridine(55) synthase TruB [Smithellaceae bacterium]